MLSELTKSRLQIVFEISFAREHVMLRSFFTLLTRDRDFCRIRELVSQLAQSGDMWPLLHQFGWDVDAHNELLNEFTALLLKREPIATVLAAHGCVGPPAQAELVALYRAMLLAGAGHSACGPYLAAAALYDSDLLDHLLTVSERRGNADDLEVIACHHVRTRGARIAPP